MPRGEDCAEREPPAAATEGPLEDSGGICGSKTLTGIVLLGYTLTSEAG